MEAIGWLAPQAITRSPPINTDGACETLLDIVEALCLMHQADARMCLLEARADV